MKGKQQRWDASYSDRLAEGDTALVGDPALVLAAHEHVLPPGGSAIDVAGGLGRNAGWLARRGLDVVVADISGIALAAIDHAALEHQLSVITELRDVESDGLGERTFDVISITYFLDRALLGALDKHLAPNGVALFAQPTLTNLERNAGPSARFCVDDGETALLAEAAERSGLVVITASESWRENGAHEAWLVVRRPATS